MSDLFKKIAALAEEKPEFRKDLVPLLKEAGLLSLPIGHEDAVGTNSLRSMKKIPAKNYGDLKSAIMSAAYYAKKLNETMFVYLGNSYMHTVWTVSKKKSEYLNPINNVGSRLYSVSPDLTIHYYDLHRDSQFTQKL